MRHPDRYEIRPQPQRWGNLLRQVSEICTAAALVLGAYVLYVVAWTLWAAFVGTP